MTKRKFTQRLFSGKVHHVDQYELKFGSGREATFDLIEFNVATGVSALPIDESGRLLLIKHYQIGLDREGWSLPTGGLEYGEDPEERMQLELQEEIGFKAGSLKLMFRQHPLPSYMGNIPGYIFLATDLTPSRLPGDEPYSITLHRLTLKKALSLIKSGKIIDARTVSAILYYHTFLS